MCVIETNQFCSAWELTRDCEFIGTAICCRLGKIESVQIIFCFLKRQPPYSMLVDFLTESRKASVAALSTEDSAFEMFELNLERGFAAKQMLDAKPISTMTIVLKISFVIDLNFRMADIPRKGDSRDLRLQRCRPAKPRASQDDLLISQSSTSDSRLQEGSDSSPRSSLRPRLCLEC